VQLRAFTFVPAFSLADLVVYDNSDIENLTFTYSPRANRWRKLPTWGEASRSDTGPFATAAVELADRRIVLRVNDAHRPLYIYEHGKWQHAANPPDVHALNSDVVVSDGRRVFVWGKPYDEPTVACWGWTPPAR
jgi:hypothetical protein